MPMAIDLGTTIVGRPTDGDHVELRSATEDDAAIVPIDVTTAALADTSPAWARYVAGVVHEVRPQRGFAGDVTTTLPVGAGLSSSAALEVAVALALGHDGDVLDLALRCQRAEQLASGVPCGLMDQWASAGGIDGHALLLDLTAMTMEPVPVPDGATVVVVHSGQHRTLAGSPYAERRASCERAAAAIGPLRDATTADLDGVSDATDRRRARHVITENARVRAFAGALRAGDLATAGACMVESHASLRDDFEVSTLALDALVERLRSTPGVHGARLTGAGFGGCVVALTEPGALDEGWTVQPSAGAGRR